MYAVHDSEGRFVGHPRSAVTAHRWSRRANMAGGAISRSAIEETRQILRSTLSDAPQGHVIDVKKLPLSMQRVIPSLVAVGADLSHDTVLLAYPKGQNRYFIVVRKGSVKAEGYGFDVPLVIRSDANRAGAESMVANTILAQLGGGGRLRAMIGAKDFSGGGNVLTFRWAARARNGANNIRITLEPSDTYKVEFFSVRGASVKSKGVFEDIYADGLIDLFERETGLYLRM